MIIGTCNEESYWALPPEIFLRTWLITKVICFQLHWKVPNFCTVVVVIMYVSLLFKTCACNLHGLKVICVSNGGYHRLVKAAPFPFIIKKGGSDFPCLLFFIWITPRERLISHTSYHIRQGGFYLFFCFHCLSIFQLLCHSDWNWEQILPDTSVDCMHYILKFQVELCLCL